MGIRYTVMIITIILYLLWMLWIGLRTRKWIDGMDDYLVAGREIGTITLSVGLFSIIAAGTTYSGATGLGYTHGMAGAIWGLSWATAAMLCAIFFTPLIRATGGFTLPEWLGMSYGRNTQIITSFPQTIGSICSGAAQLIGSAFILSGLTGWSYFTAVMVSGIVVLIYTYLGGLWAVAYTELIQGIFCIASVIITLAYLMFSYGSFDFLIANLEPSYFTYPGKLGWGPPQGNWALLTTIGCIFGYIMIVIPNTYIWTKTASSRSNKAATRGFIIAASLCVLFLTWPIAMIGMYGKAIGIEVQNSQMIFGAVIKNLPIGLDSIVLIGVLSAIMSTASGAAMGAGASATRDLYQTFFKPKSTPAELTIPSKIITFICWLFIIVLAIMFEKIGTLQMLGLSFAYFSVTFPAFVASFYFPTVKKKTVFWSVFISLIITTIYVFSMVWTINNIHPMWIGCGVSLVLLIIIHLFNKQELKEDMLVDEHDCDKIFNLISKGRTQLVYLIDETFQEGKYVQSAVDRLIERGLVIRQNNKGMGYQIFSLTEKGNEKAIYVNDEEKTLVAEYGIDAHCVTLLQRMESLIKTEGNSISFQNTKAMNNLISNDLTIKDLKILILFMNSKGALQLTGLMRASFKMNSRTKEILSKYGDIELRREAL